MQPVTIPEDGVMDIWCLPGGGDGDVVAQFRSGANPGTGISLGVIGGQVETMGSGAATQFAHLDGRVFSSAKASGGATWYAIRPRDAPPVQTG